MACAVERPRCDGSHCGGSGVGDWMWSVGGEVTDLSQTEGEHMGIRRSRRDVVRSKVRNFHAPTQTEVDDVQAAILDDARQRVVDLHNDTFASERERDLITETMLGRAWWSLKDELG